MATITKFDILNSMGWWVSTLEGPDDGRSHIEWVKEGFWS